MRVAVAVALMVSLMNACYTYGMSEALTSVELTQEVLYDYIKAVDARKP